MFAKALFAVAVLANLLVGLPVHASAHQAAVAHVAAVQADVHPHGAVASEAPCQSDDQALPAAGTSECHCQAGLGSPTLTDPGTGLALAWRPAAEHGLPLSDQIIESGLHVPLLRPPRA